MKWEWLANWTRRMANKFGGSVFDIETGKAWDWGQAICREVYGPEWANSEQFQIADESGIVPEEITHAALAWENDNWPEWALQVIYEEEDSNG